MREPHFSEPGARAANPFRMPRVTCQRRIKRRVKADTGGLGGARHINSDQPACLAKPELRGDHRRCLGKKAGQAAATTVKVDGGQRPRCLNPQPPATGKIQLITATSSIIASQSAAKLSANPDSTAVTGAAG